MQLNIENVEICRSSTMQEQSFGVGNLAVILSILRSKLYSNPVKAMIQEILSNARDAHREAGTPDKAIEIKFPCDLDPYFYIKDFGLGITPDRISKVFILYGESTKRGDNKQTGGFGIGAKSPFAYSDSFTIETITNELGYNMLRSYTAYIDESQIGKLAMMNEERTDEPTGTKITVPVKEEDYTYFHTVACDICKWWSVIPNSNIPILKANVDKEEEDYFLTPKNQSSIILIDEIPYELNKTTIKQHPKFVTLMNQFDMLGAALKLHFNNYTSCVLKFKTGELTISANRENIDYNDENMEVFAYKTKKVLESIIADISSSLQLQPNYRSAAKYICRLNIVYRELFAELQGQVKWNNIPIYESIKRFNMVRYYIYGGEVERENKEVTHNIAGNNLLVIDDTKEITIAQRIRTLLINNPTSSVDVIRPEYEWTETYETVNEETEEKTTHEKTNYCNKVPKNVTNYKLTDSYKSRLDSYKDVLAAIDVIQLSTIEPTKKAREKVEKIFECYKDGEIIECEKPAKDEKIIFITSFQNKRYLNPERKTELYYFEDYLKTCEATKDKRIYILTNTESKRYKNKISLYDYLKRYFRKKSNDPEYIRMLDITCRKYNINDEYPRLIYDSLNIPELDSIRTELNICKDELIVTDINIMRKLGFYNIDEDRPESEVEVNLRNLTNKYVSLRYFLKSHKSYDKKELKMMEILFYKEKAYEENLQKLDHNA